MKKDTNLLFFLIIFISFGTTFADDLMFEYKGRYSDTQIMIDRPATNTGLHWMKKKKKESKPLISKKKWENKQYLCYGSLQSTVNAFSGPSSSRRNCSGDSVYVKSHTRRLRSGKTVRVRAHRRKR